MSEVHHRPAGGKGGDPSAARRALRRFVKAARALEAAWHPVLEVPTYPRYLPSFDKLVSELADESTLFARLWSRHDVRFHTDGLDLIRLRHPVVGPMEFHVQSMVLNGRVGTLLSAYYTEPDSATARKLAELSSTAAR